MKQGGRKEETEYHRPYSGSVTDFLPSVWAEKEANHAHTDRPRMT